MKRGTTDRAGTRPQDPLQLDVAAFARDGGSLSGQWPLKVFQRLCDGWPEDAPRPVGDVLWAARGALRRSAPVDPEVRLELRLQTRVWRECQRCLQPVEVPLQVERWLRFVPGEDAAATLDVDSEDDVLELTPRLDLRTLAEDELLLALPLVPHHDACAAPPFRGVDGGSEDAEPHPFAALASLKRGAGSPH